MRIEIAHHDQFAQLRDELLATVTPSYVDPAYIVDWSIARNNQLYLGRDDVGDLVCFLFVAWESIDETPMAYMGLSAARQSAKGTGAFRALYEQFNRDAVGRVAWIWAKTATANVYRALDAIFADLSPRPDGAFASDAEALAAAAKRSIDYTSAPGAHPFALKRVTATRYSPTESGRVQAFVRAKQFDLFERLGLDELDGDRLIVVFRPRR